MGGRRQCLESACSIEATRGCDRGSAVPALNRCAAPPPRVEGLVSDTKGARATEMIRTCFSSSFRSSTFAALLLLPLCVFVLAPTHAHSRAAFTRMAIAAGVEPAPLCANLLNGTYSVPEITAIEPDDASVRVDVGEALGIRITGNNFCVGMLCHFGGDANTMLPALNVTRTTATCPFPAGSFSKKFWFIHEFVKKSFVVPSLPLLLTMLSICAGTPVRALGLAQAGQLTLSSDFALRAKHSRQRRCGFLATVATPQFVWHRLGMCTRKL